MIRIPILLLLLLVPVLTIAEPPKVDFFFPPGVQRGVETPITCHGNFEWPLQVWTSAGRITTLEEKGKMHVYVPPDYPSDRIWIRLFDATGATLLRPLLVGNLRSETEVEPNNTAEQAQQINPQFRQRIDCHLHGTLQKSGDVDVFAVTLAKNETLVAAVSANTTIGAPIDAILQIATEQGTVLCENHDRIGLDPQLVYSAREDGVYLVRVFAFPAKPNQRIQFYGDKRGVYQLTLTTGPFIQFAMPMAANLTTTGIQPPTVQVLGSNLPAGTRLPLISVQPHAGTVFSPGWVGMARLHLADAVPSTPVTVATEQSPHILTTPESATGVIQRPATRHYFRIAMKQNKKNVLHLQGPSFHSLLAPQMRLRDAAGKIVAQTPEGGPVQDAKIHHTPTKDADFTLEVSDRFGHGGNEHLYCISATVPKPSFRLTFDRETLTVLPGTAVELTIQIDRSTGDGTPIEDISISAAALPDGVTCEPIISQAKGDSAKQVTLQFNAEDGVPYSGLFRVLGTVAATGKTQVATMEKLGYPIDHIWLTVPPAALADESKDHPDDQAKKD